MTIHPTAVIDPTTTIEEGVEVGAFTVIGPNCHIGKGSKILNQVVIEKNTRLGEGCQVASNAIIGGDPQDFGFKGEETFVEIGDRTVVREFVTVNRASGEGQITKIGSDSMVMAYAHVGHNAQISDHVVMANNVQVAGHVEIGEHVFISGFCLLHQNIRIGRMAMLSPVSGSRQDVPPFSMCVGRPLSVAGMNKIGLRRNGVGLQQRKNIQHAFKLLMFSKLTQKEAIAQVRSEITDDPYVDELVTFFETSKRGIRRANTTEMSEDSIKEILELPTPV